MIQTGTCVPTPGLKKAFGVYACATGVLYPQVLVDPMVRTLPGEQALVAHEMAHVEGRHALKFIVAVVFAVHARPTIERLVTCCAERVARPRGPGRTPEAPTCYLVRHGATRGRGAAADGTVEPGGRA